MTTITTAPAPATLTDEQLDAIKTEQQATWASGDFAVIGTTLQLTGELLCEAVGVEAGLQVLDVGAGNGNAALAAARAVVGVGAVDVAAGGGGDAEVHLGEQAGVDADGDVVGYRGWNMSSRTYNSFFASGRNNTVTTAPSFSNVASVYQWEPLTRNGQNLVANRVDNPNGDATRLGVTSRPFSGDDNQPGLGTGMNLDCCGPNHRHADVELQWNTNTNIWCESVGDGRYKWLGSDVLCGSSCGSCQPS